MRTVHGRLVVIGVLTVTTGVRPAWSETQTPPTKVKPQPAARTADTRHPETRPPVQLEGLWPSPKQRDLMLARWAERVARKYRLDDKQRARLREVLVKRWGEFLAENRATIQPLVNEWLEMRLDLHPPPKERVQSWAERMLPVFDKFRGQLEESTAELREVLTPLQRAQLEIDALQLRVGLQLAEQKIKRWRKGEYAENDFWSPPGADRRARRAERKRRKRADRTADGRESQAVGRTRAEGSPSAQGPRGLRAAAQEDQILLELAAWDEYVRTFMRVYNLDEGQRNAVLSVLSELKERALAHRDHRREEIAGLERRIATFSGSDEELAELKKELIELYGPIDDMFKELKRRIEQIPTAGQRETAARNAE